MSGNWETNAVSDDYPRSSIWSNEIEFEAWWPEVRPKLWAILRSRLFSTDYGFGTYDDILSDLALRVYLWQERNPIRECGVFERTAKGVEGVGGRKSPGIGSADVGKPEWLQRRQRFAVVCLKHLWIDYVRKSSGFLRSPLGAREVGEMEALASDVEPAADHSGRSPAPGAALDIEALAGQLPPAEREVFLLEAKGFTHKQTAERLQKEEPNVRRLFLKAKARLAALIKLDEEMDSL